MAGNLDSLMELAAGGEKALHTLERLEQKRDDSMERLGRLLEQVERSGPDADLEKRALKAANQAQSQVNQADAVGRMVQNSALKYKDGIAALIAQAGKAAAQKAESVAAAVMACAVNPEVILIGGGVSAAGRALLDPVEAAFRENVFPPCGRTRFAQAELGNNAGIFGGAALFFC